MQSIKNDIVLRATHARFLLLSFLLDSAAVMLPTEVSLRVKIHLFVLERIRFSVATFPKLAYRLARGYRVLTPTTFLDVFPYLFTNPVYVLDVVRKNGLSLLTSPLLNTNPPEQCVEIYTRSPVGTLFRLCEEEGFLCRRQTLAFVAFSARYKLRDNHQLVYSKENSALGKRVILVRGGVEDLRTLMAHYFGEC